MSFHDWPLLCSTSSVTDSPLRCRVTNNTDGRGSSRAGDDLLLSFDPDQ